eukprot:278615-Hanusia_phi.AAC.1
MNRHCDLQSRDLDNIRVGNLTILVDEFNRTQREDVVPGTTDSKSTFPQLSSHSTSNHSSCFLSKRNMSSLLSSVQTLIVHFLRNISH